MKKLLFIILSLFLVNNLQAETVMLSESSIAIVDMQQIITASKASKALRDAVEKKSAEYEKEAKALEEKLNKNNQELSKQRSVLSEEAYAEKLREFENKIIEAQRNTKEKQKQLALGFENALAEISNAVSEIVSKLSGERNFTIVIPSTGLLYAKNNLDITSEVLNQLNNKLPSMSLKLEPLAKIHDEHNKPKVK